MPFSSSQTTRDSLLARAKQLDQSAWSTLVDLYAPLVAHRCRRFHLDEHAIADCMQEIFAAVAGALDSYSTELQTASFRGWLWQISRNKIIDHLRRTKRFPVVQGGTTAFMQLNHVEDPISVPDPEQTDASVLNRLYKNAFVHIEPMFEPRTWQIFSRSIMDGVDTELVATEFDIQPATVRKVRSRVLRKLREFLGELQ